MVQRIKAAADARSEMIIVGRTDALGVGKTLDEAIERGIEAQAYIITGPTCGIVRATALEPAKHGMGEL